MGDSACVMQSFSYASPLSNESKQGNPMHVLGESISFGRYMTESLSWEKWSTFSHKKYVEEAERYSQPGSVAQKKAFFEAHYKRIAAQKAAALLEQENAAKTETAGVGDSNAYEDQRVAFNSYSNVDVNMEDVKIKQDFSASEGITSVAGNKISDLSPLKTSPIQTKTPPRLSKEYGTRLSKEYGSRLSKEYGPRLSKEYGATQSTNKFNVDKNSSSPNALGDLMNLVPIKEPDKNPISANSTTPLAVEASAKNVSTYPAATPQSENKRTRTPVDLSPPGSKTGPKKLRILSALCFKSPTSSSPTIIPGPKERSAKTKQERTGNLCFNFCFKARPMP